MSAPTTPLLPEFILKDTLFLEVRYDNKPSRFLVTPRIKIKEDKEVWNSVLYHYSDTSIPLKDRVLLKYEDIYPAILTFCQVSMGIRPFKREWYNPKLKLKEPEIEAILYEDFNTPYEMAAFMIKELAYAKIIDEYLYFNDFIQIDYHDEKGNDFLMISSSDSLENFLESAGRDVIVNGLNFKPHDYEFFPSDRGRFLVKQDEYYVLRLKSGYLLSEKEDAQLLLTKHCSRAMKFICEDEALAYAMSETGERELEFEVERIDKPAYLARSKSSSAFSLREMEGLSINKSYPFLSIETDRQRKE